MKILRKSYTYWNLHKGTRRKLLGAYISKNHHCKLSFYCTDIDECNLVLTRLKESNRLYDRIQKHKTKHIVYCKTSINSNYYNLGEFNEDMLNIKDYKTLIKTYELPNTRGFSEQSYMEHLHEQSTETV